MSVSVKKFLDCSLECEETLTVYICPDATLVYGLTVDEPCEPCSSRIMHVGDTKMTFFCSSHSGTTVLVSNYAVSMTKVEAFGEVLQAGMMIFCHDMSFCCLW